MIDVLTQTHRHINKNNIDGEQENTNTHTMENAKTLAKKT